MHIIMEDKMKKIIFALACLALAFSFVSCEKKSAEEKSQVDIEALESKINELEAKLSETKSTEETAENSTPAPVEKQTSKWKGDSYIRIDSPRDEDEKYLYNVYNVDEVKLDFTGSVSPDCQSIRVIWAPYDSKYIQEYLEGRRTKVPDQYGYDETDVIKIDDWTLKEFKPGDTTFAYHVGGKLDNLIQGTNCYRFIATFEDGSQKTYSLTYYVYCGGGAEKAKPVIYLYPKKKQNVTVSVSPEGGVIESIPEMGKEWKVTAWPDGKIVEKKSKKEYPYLYWESRDKDYTSSITEGFVIATEEAEDFFKEKLTVLGLNEKEIADFNEYWIPELSGKPYLYITFIPQEQQDKEAPLTVSPKPDSVIRVFFDHRKLDEPIEVEEQILTPRTRSGFAVVEWGGRRYR